MTAARLVCPVCGGPTNFSREYPPTPYVCEDCEEVEMTTNNPELTPVPCTCGTLTCQGQPGIYHHSDDYRIVDYYCVVSCNPDYRVACTIGALGIDREDAEQRAVERWNTLHTPPEPEWQPVETMPNEGAFLVDLGDGQLSIVTLEGYKNENLVNLVKGWMPLPKPASSNKEGDE